MKTIITLILGVILSLNLSASINHKALTNSDITDTEFTEKLNEEFRKWSASNTSMDIEKYNKYKKRLDQKIKKLKSAEKIAEGWQLSK